MSLKQLTVFVENKQGTLVDITDTLAKHNVNIRALSIADTQDFGILRLIVNDNDIALKTLSPTHRRCISPTWGVNTIEEIWWFNNSKFSLKQLIPSASITIGVYEFLFFFKKLTINSLTPPTEFNPQPIDTTS